MAAASLWGHPAAFCQGPLVLLSGSPWAQPGGGYGRDPGCLQNPEACFPCDFTGGLQGPHSSTGPGLGQRGERLVLGPDGLGSIPSSANCLATL